MLKCKILEENINIWNYDCRCPIYFSIDWIFLCGVSKLNENDEWWKISFFADTKLSNFFLFYNILGIFNQSLNKYRNAL